MQLETKTIFLILTFENKASIPTVNILIVI